MSKLLPCPFCGGAPEWHGAAPPGNEDASWASCETEGCPVTEDCECGSVVYFPSAAWNARPIESALRSQVEALERTGGIPDEVLDLLDLMTGDAGAHRQREGVVAASAKAEERFLAARVQARRVEALEGALDECLNLLEHATYERAEGESDHCVPCSGCRQAYAMVAEKLRALQPDKGERCGGTGKVWSEVPPGAGEGSYPDGPCPGCPDCSEAP